MAPLPEANYFYFHLVAIIEERGDEPLRHLLTVLGEWPVLQADWNESTFDLEMLMATLRLLNNRVIISDWVSSDDRNSSTNILQVRHHH